MKEPAGLGRGIDEWPPEKKIRQDLMRCQDDSKVVRLGACRMTEEEEMQLQSREVWRKNRSGRTSDLGGV